MSSPKSLRRRLTWYVVITMLIMSGLSGVGVYLGITHEIDEIFDASLVQSARVLDGLVSREIIDANRQELLDALDRSRQPSQDRESHKYEKKIFFVLLDTDGGVLLESQRAPELPADIGRGGFFRFEEGKRHWITFALHSSRDEIIIVVGERTDIRKEVTEYIGFGFLYPLIVMLPAVVWMLWQLVGVALKPLQTVVDQVRAQDLRDLQVIDAEGVPQEIDPLVNSMNDMIARLDSAYARERRFVSDASHELRNPLASLLINIDNALEENSDPETIESLQQMKTSIVRLSHLVSQLLELSHSENPLSGREFTEIDLQQLCAEVVASHQRQARAAGVDLVYQATEQDCRLTGAHALLGSLLANLVDNGIKYCGSGGKVVVSCTRDGSRLTLGVEDSGEGLDAATRARVVERFYRADQADTSGAGLGLAIVKSIAEIHTAEMRLDDSRLGGLAVRIDFDLG